MAILKLYALEQDRVSLSAQREDLAKQLAQQQSDRQALVDAYKQTRSNLKDVEALIALDAEVAHLRAQLKSGEPCPVCGANEHTTSSVVIDVPETIQKRDSLKQQLDDIEQQGAQAKESVTHTEFTLVQVNKQLEQASGQRDTLLEKWQQISSVLRHLTALGVSQSESVRDIYIGTLEGFDAKGFPPADYIALGHIHRPQKVAKTEHIRYSGSPIPLSFDELTTQKQVVLVAFECESTTPTISTLPVPRFQAMEVIKGDLKAIEAAINNSDAIALASQTDDAVSEVDKALSDVNKPLSEFNKAISEMNKTVSATDNTISTVRLTSSAQTYSAP